MQLIKFFLFCFLLTAIFNPWPLNSAAAGQAEARILLVPELTSELSSQIDAQITRIHVKQGEHFQKGQLLIEFDCAIINAHLTKARIELTAATETYNANLELQEFGSNSLLDVAVASARKKMAQAEVLVQETTAKQCEIKAPFSGRVVKLTANPFETVSPKDPLIEIIDQRLKARLLLPSRWLTWIKPGLAFPVAIDETGKKYQAKLTSFGACVNPVNQTLEVYAEITGSHPELLSGMSGMAYFKTPPGKSPKDF